MALPASGAPWPGAPYDIALRQQAVWSAWLEGDAAKLASVYGGAATSSNPTAASFFNRSGGILPAIGRLFWGRPNVTGQTRYKLHVPLAADIATASADLLFSEPPQFIVGDPADKESKAQKRVDECFNQGDFHASMIEAAEITAGLGGCFLRLVWDKELFDWVRIDPVDADAGLAEWEWGNKLAAVTFFTEVERDREADVVWRHLERHEPGWILHGLYKGTSNNLGIHTRLEEQAATEGLAAMVNEDGGIPTGVRGVTVGYVANMRPQKAWRKIGGLADLGRSDFDGPVMALMDALDETYTSWMRDLRLAKARLLVPEEFLKDLGRGKGSTFDEDQEVFTTLKMMPDKSQKQITPQQFKIRVEEHKATADQLIDHILDTAGYSSSTFGHGDEGMQTATEVVSKERKSERTRDKKTRYWTQAFNSIFPTWAELDRAIYRKGADDVITVKWPDVVQPDAEALSRTLSSLRTAEAASTYVMVGMLHPDWNEEKIKEETIRIEGERGMLVPEPGVL